MYQLGNAKDNPYQLIITLLLTRSEVSDFFTVTGAKAAAEPTKKVRAIEAEKFIIFVSIDLEDNDVVAFDILCTYIQPQIAKGPAQTCYTSARSNQGTDRVP